MRCEISVRPLQRLAQASLFVQFGNVLIFIGERSGSRQQRGGNRGSNGHGYVYPVKITCFHYAILPLLFMGCRRKLLTKAWCGRNYFLDRNDRQEMARSRLGLLCWRHARRGFDIAASRIEHCFRKDCFARLERRADLRIPLWRPPDSLASRLRMTSRYLNISPDSTPKF